jgi:predicted Ser/Thr protein kinase
MSKPARRGAGRWTPAQALQIEEVCGRFEAAWRTGPRPRLQDYLRELGAPPSPALLEELLALEIALRRQAGERPSLPEYLELFPQQDVVVRAAFPAEPAVVAPKAGAEGEDSAPDAGDVGLSTPWPQPGGDGQRSAANVTDPAATETLPRAFGRYRVTAKLGEGSFGVVYRGRDEVLHRDVAIKVSHRKRMGTPAAIEAYLAEARILASLDHAGIVPVYDAGQTDDGLCYVVSKVVDGTDLKTRLEQGRPAWTETVTLLASVAEALHHAHRRGLVHRDIKPANILLDAEGRPVVADFGLALREKTMAPGPPSQAHQRT